MDTFEALGARERGQELEAYRVMSTPQVVEAMKIVYDAAKEAFQLSWSNTGQASLNDLTNCLTAVNSWKEAVEEELL